MTETPNPHIVDTDTLTGEMHPIRRAVLALGSNLGERLTSLQGAVDALQSASSPMVQIALIDFVVGARETRSIETLKKLAADPSLNEMVRMRASQGLDRFGAKS